MPDALEVAAQQDAYFASTGKLIGPLHGVVFSIKDQYDTFDMRTTGGWMPLMRTIVLRRCDLRQALAGAGAIIVAKANLGEMGTPETREAPSAGPSVTLTIRRGLPAPRAAAPERRWRQTW